MPRDYFGLALGKALEGGIAGFRDERAWQEKLARNARAEAAAREEAEYERSKEEPFDEATLTTMQETGRVTAPGATRSNQFDAIKMKAAADLNAARNLRDVDDTWITEAAKYGVTVPAGTKTVSNKLYDQVNAAKIKDSARMQPMDDTVRGIFKASGLPFDENAETYDVGTFKEAARLAVTNTRSANSEDRMARLIKLRDQMRDDNEIVLDKEADDIVAQFKDAGIDVKRERLIGNRRSTLANLLPKQVLDPGTGETLSTGAPRSQLSTLPGSGDISKQAKSLMDSLSTMNSVKEQYSALAKAGKTGILSGNLEQFKGLVSGGKFAPDATAYNNFKAGLIASVKDIVGQSGVMSNQDMNQIEKLLPPIGMDAVAAARQFEKIDRLIEDRVDNWAAAYPQFKTRIDTILRGAPSLNVGRQAATPAAAGVSDFDGQSTEYTYPDGRKAKWDGEKWVPQ